jgi:hypothetical protein
LHLNIRILLSNIRIFIILAMCHWTRRPGNQDSIKYYLSQLFQRFNCTLSKLENWTSSIFSKNLMTVNGQCALWMSKTEWLSFQNLVIAVVNVPVWRIETVIYTSISTPAETSTQKCDQNAFLLVFKLLVFFAPTWSLILIVVKHNFMPMKHDIVHRCECLQLF